MLRIWGLIEPSLVIHNARVHTVAADDAIVSAIAVAGDRVMAIGACKEVLSLAGQKTQVVDAQGRSIIPGINDTHNHAWEAGRLLAGVLTFGLTSIVELQEKLAAKAAQLPAGEWIQGGGWIETQFSENRMPNRWDLDKATSEHPVVLERIFSACVANSVALQLAGITRDTPDPEEGEIERDSTGEPTGVLHRSAKLLVRQVMPGPFGASSFGRAAGAKDSIQLANEEYLRYGITSIVEPGVSPALCADYQQLRDEGKLKMRVNLMPNWHGFALKQEAEHMERLIEEMGIYTGFGDEWLRLGALKMAIDGGLTSRTALKSWPYLGEELPREVPLRLDVSRLDSWVKQAHDAGWSVGIHVVGDISQDLAVDAIYKAYKDNPVIRRHQIIHGYYATEASLCKMREAGIIAAVQPSFIYGEADGYADLLPADKRDSFLPLRSYHEAGVVVSISTDMPSAHHSPFYTLYAAATRCGLQGYQLGTREAVDVPTALRMMTINGAYLTGEEAVKGSLEPGKLADLVMLDRDLLATPLEELKDISVEMTVLGGRQVYSRS